MPDTALHEDPAALVAACLEGDERAWRRLVELYSPLLWTIARSHRLSTVDCQDVYQITWLQLVQHLHKLRSPERLTSWITTATRRECLKHIERTRRYLPVGAGDALDVPNADDHPDQVAMQRIRQAEVLAAFRRLPARDQALLGLLSADAAPSYDEVSRLLGVPRGSLGPLRRRALGRLRALLPVSVLE